MHAFSCEPTTPNSVRVISLARANDRREVFKREWGRYGLSYNWFEAIDRRIVDAVQIPACSYGKGRMMKSGEIACLMSHRSLWSSVVYAQKPMLIFEDDALPTIYADAFYGVLAKAIAEHPNMEAMHLGHGVDGKNAFAHVFNSPDDVAGIATAKGWGNYSYWITPAGAHRALELTHRLNIAADWIWQDFIDRKTLCILRKPVTKHTSVVTYIGNMGRKFVL